MLDLLRRAAVAPPRPAFDPAALVRIRPLGPADAPVVLRHLLALPPEDLRARFGALPTDTTLARFCAGLDLGREIGIGAFDAAKMPVGIALACACAPGRVRAPVEVAISVLPAHRRRGLGATLVAQACGVARARGARVAVFEVMPGNDAMRGLLRHLGVQPAPGDAPTLLPLTRDG